MDSFRIVNKASQKAAIDAILDLDMDGSKTVKIIDSGSKRARQRGLQWVWYTYLAKLGIGGKHEDTKDGVHLLCKYRFAVPILCRDDEFFGDLWGAWKQKHGEDKEAMLWFVDHQVSTEGFTTGQMAEYLTDMDHYYANHGIYLPPPNEKSLIELSEIAA